MSDFDSQTHVRSDDKTKFLATVYGAGVAGTPDAGVMTVQGIAGATPVPVTITTPDDYNVDGLPNGTVRNADSDTQAAVASGAAAATPIATIAITAAKNGYVRGLTVSSSGLGKFELLVGATFGAATPIAPPVMTSLGDLTKQVTFQTPIPVAGGDNVYIKGTNRDKVAQDLYGMIDAYETV